MMRETHTNCFVPIFLSLLLDGVGEYFCLSQISPVKKCVFLQNRKKGVLRGEERLDGKAAKRFLALPPHSLPFLTPLTFARDCLFCLHFWMKVFFLLLTLSFSNISGSILRGNGRVMKICKYVLPSGICALLQRLWRDEPIQIASAVAKT